MAVIPEQAGLERYDPVAERERFGRPVREIEDEEERRERTRGVPLKASVDTKPGYGSTDGIKDSGQREEFSTGSVRDKQAGRGAFHLVPTWVVWLVSRVYEGGAIKYAPRNWEKGQPLSQYIKSAENHLAKLKMGMRDEPHASQVVWNMFGYIYTSVLIKLGRRPGSLSDMPDQLHCVPGVIAEPLSNMEYESMNTFFQGAEKIDIPEEGPHLSVEEEKQKQQPPADPKHFSLDSPLVRVPVLSRVKGDGGS
jgi:hypothetical protein